KRIRLATSGQLGRVLLHRRQAGSVPRPINNPNLGYDATRGSRPAGGTYGDLSTIRTWVTMRPIVLFEDNHLLVLNKPAMLATMGVDAARPSLVQVAKEYVRAKYQKPGNVYLGVVSRLDLPVSGVIVFARTSKSAARLTRQFLERTVEKTYWALVWPPLPSDEGVLRDWLLRDEPSRRMLVRQRPAPGAQSAVTRYRVRRTTATRQWLELRPETGRRHQLRAQLAAHGCPILGDRRYGSSETFPRGIALHSRSLTLEHPTRKVRLTWEAPLPGAWPDDGLHEDAAPL
ncbi:MAG TPA: RluA family pseudouridine synthase, partial [Pirellulaceae bacterium]